MCVRARAHFDTDTDEICTDKLVLSVADARRCVCVHMGASPSIRAATFHRLTPLSNLTVLRVGVRPTRMPAC